MPTPELLAVGAIFILALGVVLLLLGRAGWVEFRGPFGFLARRHVPPDPPVNDPTFAFEGVKLALEQYGEVTQALEALIRSDAETVEAAARQWFSTLAIRLGICLKEQRHHMYRVAIWLDDPRDAERFVSIGHGVFDNADHDMDALERAYTIGGLGFSSRTGSYYCHDTRTDPQFKPRKTVPPRYQSVFARALGARTDPWGG